MSMRTVQSSLTFIIQNSSEEWAPESFDAEQLEELYNYYFVHDQLEPAPSTESLSRMLHRWMPRAGFNIAGTPIHSVRSPRSPQVLSPLQVGVSGTLRPTAQGLSAQLLPGAEAGAAGLRLAPPGSFPLRMLIVSSCPLSADVLNLIHYAEIFMIFVDHVDTGEAAMERLSATDRARYDLIVTEPELSGTVSGYALCSWWREHTEVQQGGITTVGGTIITTPCDCVALSEAPDDGKSALFGIKYCLMKPLSVYCFAHLMLTC